jgi:hypothetical protein
MIVDNGRIFLFPIMRKKKDTYCDVKGNATIECPCCGQIINMEIRLWKRTHKSAGKKFLDGIIFKQKDTDWNKDKRRKEAQKLINEMFNTQ